MLCDELHILGWHFIVGSLMHTCVIIRLSNKYLDWDYMHTGEVLRNRDLGGFVNII